MTPKVSVILCTYNAEKDIHNTLESILNQSYKNIEVLILDNDSKDKTIEIIKTNKDPRIKLFPSEKNL
jgi:succinoglycan biosynthesis protein ExoO